MFSRTDDTVVPSYTLIIHFSLEKQMLLPMCKSLSQQALIIHISNAVFAEIINLNTHSITLSGELLPHYVEGTKYSQKCHGRRKLSYWCNWRPMRMQYFTPLLCHYAECTIYPQRCYDKQTSSLFARYNLRFVIRFNIELRPFTSSSSQSLYLRY